MSDNFNETHLANKLNAANAAAALAQEKYEVATLSALEGTSDATAQEKASQALAAARRHVSDLEAAQKAAEARATQQRKAACEAEESAVRAELRQRLQSAHVAAKKWDAAADALLAATKAFSNAVDVVQELRYPDTLSTLASLEGARNDILSILSIRGSLKWTPLRGGSARMLPDGGITLDREIPERLADHLAPLLAAAAV